MVLNLISRNPHGPGPQVNKFCPSLLSTGLGQSPRSTSGRAHLTPFLLLLLETAESVPFLPGAVNRGVQVRFPGKRARPFGTSFIPLPSSRRIAPKGGIVTLLAGSFVVVPPIENSGPEFGLSFNSGSQFRTNRERYPLLPCKALGAPRRECATRGAAQFPLCV